ILVSTLLMSTVTVVPALPDGGEVVTYAGAANVFDEKSLPKKPIVAANAGSFGGAIVVSVPDGGGVVVLPTDDFLHDPKMIDPRQKIIIAEKTFCCFIFISLHFYSQGKD
ncbi:MAG: hypothetical protein ABUT20_55515, partial [Bacteroidota bacterium]